MLLRKINKILYIMENYTDLDVNRVIADLEVLSAEMSARTGGLLRMFLISYKNIEKRKMKDVPNENIVEASFGMSSQHMFFFAMKEKRCFISQHGVFKKEGASVFDLPSGSSYSDESWNKAIAVFGGAATCFVEAIESSKSLKELEYKLFFSTTPTQIT